MLMFVVFLFFLLSVFSAHALLPAQGNAIDRDRLDSMPATQRACLLLVMYTLTLSTRGELREEKTK